VPDIPAIVGAVAVCLLHADLDPAHEQQVVAALSVGDREVVASHEVSPEFREYERTVTTVVDAFLRPVTRSHLRDLGAVADEVLVMSSAGGLVTLAEAMDHPASLLLSGPAAGVRAAAAAAASAGFADAVSFDMGGTSSDVCLISGGVPEADAERTVSGLPVRVPALDVHTIGAGGGSIAGLDAGGALTVGPQSAGAEPGPACYGRGGTAPTVTDADLVLGRIPADAVLPGIGPLRLQAAKDTLDGAGLAAQGVIDVVDTAMAQAVRVVTVERGIDPRHLALVAFGGAGPLHACAMADLLGMAVVVIPPRAGVLSAVGLLGSPRQAVSVRSWPNPRDHGPGLQHAASDLASEAVRRLGDSAAQVELGFDCRYEGQSHEITVPSLSTFEDEHHRRNGFARPGAQVEVTAIRATARLSAPIDPGALPVPPGRAPAEGPGVLVEEDCTVWLAEGWTAQLAEGGSWILRRSRS
jgi:N-methylhydantoinase A/oxoprolinase/acetone carboxylase beta subunit